MAKINVAECAVLASQGVPYRVLADKYGVKMQSVARSMHRHNVGALSTRSTQQTLKRAEQVASRVLDRLSENTRAKLAEVAHAQADALAQVRKVSVDDLRNTPDAQGLAAVAETVSKTAERVFGWSDAPTQNPLGPGSVSAIVVFSQEQERVGQSLLDNAQNGVIDAETVDNQGQIADCAGTTTEPGKSDSVSG